MVAGSLLRNAAIRDVQNNGTWHPRCLCRVRGVMTNITALLLVLMLTGAPVGSVVCVTECQHEPATSGHCHGNMATSDRPMMSASDRCDDLSISESPYLIEHRAVPGAAVLTTTSFLTTLTLVGTDAPAVFARTSDALLAPPPVLRL